MPRRHDPSVPVELGDVVTLPDGRSLSLRAAVTLESPVGSMAGFWILGELEVLLATPVAHADPHNVYLPIERFPVNPKQAQTRALGSTRYWAPHLPSIGGAMGELLYRVIEVEGSIDPIVVVYRGPEATVFVRTSFAFGSDLDVQAMRRDRSNETDVDRYSADVTVSPVSAPPVPLYSTFSGTR